MMTASQMWSSATGQYGETWLSCPPKLTLQPSNHSQQSHRNMGNHLPAKQKRLNPKRPKLNQTRCIRWAAAPRTPVMVALRANRVNPVGQNTEERAAIKILPRYLSSAPTHRTRHCDICATQANDPGQTTAFRHFVNVHLLNSGSKPPCAASKGISYICIYILEVSVRSGQ